MIIGDQSRRSLLCVLLLFVVSCRTDQAAWPATRVSPSPGRQLLGVVLVDQEPTLIWEGGSQQQMQRCSWQDDRIQLHDPMPFGFLKVWPSQHPRDSSMVWFDSDYDKQLGYQWLVRWSEVPGGPVFSQPYEEMPFDLAKARCGLVFLALHRRTETDAVVLSVSHNAGVHWSAPIPVPGWTLSSGEDYHLAMTASHFALVALPNDGQSPPRLRRGRIRPDGLRFDSEDYELLNGGYIRVFIDEYATYVVSAASRLTVLRLPHHSATGHTVTISGNPAPVAVQLLRQDDGRLLLAWLDARRATYTNDVSPLSIVRTWHRDVYAALILDQHQNQAEEWLLSTVGREATDLFITPIKGDFMVTWLSYPIDGSSRRMQSASLDEIHLCLTMVPQVSQPMVQP